MTTEQAIENILKEQVSNYKLLHKVLEEERRYLVNINLEKFEEIAKEKDTIIMRLRLLEEERQRLIQQFIDEKNIKTDFNLRQMEEITGNKNFGCLRSNLISILQSIEEMNKFNSILIERSLKYFKTTAGFVNLFRTQQDTQGPGALVSRES